MLALGVYPDVRIVQARAHHRETRQQLASGIDPAAKEQASGLTFEMVARQWHTKVEWTGLLHFSFYGAAARFTEFSISLQVCIN